MVFVRGVKGNVKLHPGIKFWGSLALFVFIIIAGLVTRISDFSDNLKECEARGGVWVGGLVPARVGSFRSISSYCVEVDEREETW